MRFLKRPLDPLSWLAGFSATILTLGPAGCFAQAAAQDRTVSMPRVKIIDYRLKNGLRVLLAPDKASPVVSVCVTYDVGSRNEQPGRTGFAHLFEHLMFQGSENVGRGEADWLINGHGGRASGTTEPDRTNYFATLPANQLDLLLFIEADRMRALDINQENLDNQRAVVKEERRMRHENQPYGQVFMTLESLAYTSFAYKHSTIGEMLDLDAARLADVRSFFKVYYVPNNAVLTIAGAVDVAEARKSVARYFGAIPLGPAPPPVDVREAAFYKERRQILPDRLARLPRYSVAYRTVPGDHPDFYALSILAGILGGIQPAATNSPVGPGAASQSRRTTRLYQALMEQNLALRAHAEVEERRVGSLFLIEATLPSGGIVETVEKRIEEELARLQNEGPRAAELERVREWARVDAVALLLSAEEKAIRIGADTVCYNDPSRINALLPRLQAVTAADVQRVARQYLTRANRAVVVSQPAGGVPETGPVSPRPPTAGAGTTPGGGER